MAPQINQLKHTNGNFCYYNKGKDKYRDAEYFPKKSIVIRYERK